MRQADRLIINVLANYGRMAVEIAAGFVVVPIVVRDLSRSGFGLAALILAVVMVFRRLSDAIGRAMQRHIPQDLGGEDPGRVRHTFNTALAGFAVMGLVGGLVVWTLHDWLFAGLEIDASMIADANLAFYVLVAWLVVAMPGFSYRRGLHAIQRYDVEGAITGGVTMAQALVVIILFTLGHGSITVYVGARLLGWLVVCLLCRRALLRLTPGLVESPRFVDWKSARVLGAFSAMSALMIAGSVLGNQGLRVFVGKRLGLSELGGLAAVLTIIALQMRLIDNVTSVLIPAISTEDARGARGNVAKLLASGTKYSVVLTAMMCVVPIPLAGAFLKLWLGDEFAGLGVLLVALFITQIPRSLGTTSQAVLMGLGKLRFVTPIMSVQGAVGLLLAAGYVAWIGPSLTGAAVCCFAAQGVARLATLVYSSRVTGVSLRRILAEALALPLGMGLAGGLTTWVIAGVIGDDQWWRLAVALTAGEVVFLGLVLTRGLGEEERSRLLSFALTARLRVRHMVHGAGGGAEDRGAH